MVVGLARVVLHLPASGSLKDKRQVLKSLLAQTQRQFQVAAAEIEKHDQRQLGVVGLACVTTDSGHADQVIARAVNFIASRLGDAELLDYQTEIVHVF